MTTSSTAIPPAFHAHVFPGGGEEANGPSPASAAQPDFSLLLIDDSPPMIQMLARMLAGVGRLRFATSGAAALAQLRASPVDPHASRLGSVDPEAMCR